MLSASRDCILWWSQARILLYDLLPFLSHSMSLCCPVFVKAFVDTHMSAITARRFAWYRFLVIELDHYLTHTFLSHRNDKRKGSKKEVKQFNSERSVLIVSFATCDGKSRS